MKILVSNERFSCARLKQLAKNLRANCNITVVAPDRNRSGASNSLTLDNPLRVMLAEMDFLV